MPRSSRSRVSAATVGVVLLNMAAAAAAAQEPSRPISDAILAPVIVTAPPPVAASSELLIPGKDFELLPHGRPADVLRLVPGLIMSQHQGGGKAEQYMLRGFDADHGTDVALFVDGMPVNLRTHAHGQGYADLHFLIPETIKQVDAFKGPYYVEYGDFATAGAIDFVTLDTVPENLVEAWRLVRHPALPHAALPHARSHQDALRTRGVYLRRPLRPPAGLQAAERLREGLGHPRRRRRRLDLGLLSAQQLV